MADVRRLASHHSVMADRRITGPLLVYGPRSRTYDFGATHPLSPRRFGPGIDLLRAVGAEPGLAPEPATDGQLEWLHSPGYLAAVKRFSIDPGAPPEAGIGPGDDPAFAGMHEAAAAVAGGSISAVEAILRGDAEHAYQPGGGLHHAMRDRASGFCVYNDVALAIARARREGLRVLYVDLDVHHGDGVQALHYEDPGVLTISFHESGRSLFPGSGFVDELGEGSASGTSVNIPLEPHCGPDAWLGAVRSLVPAAAAAFGPDIVVSQHGADGHVWDPLAHLCLTTTAMGEAARLVDRVAHRYASGRWFATGGGGYSIYRVVPRAWALTWLAGAHRDVPGELPADWMERWEGDAVRWERGALPAGFEDEAGVVAGIARPDAGVQARRTIELVRTLAVPALLRTAEERGWWAVDGGPGRQLAAAEPPAGEPAIVVLTADVLANLRLASRTVAPADPAEGHALLAAALRDGATATGAILGEWVVGVAIAAPSGASTPAPTPAPAGASGAGGSGGASGSVGSVDDLLALGVAPRWRGRGVARSLLRSLCAIEDEGGRAIVALHTVAERDPFDPLPREVRRSVAGRLLDSASFRRLRAPGSVTAADPDAILAVRRPSRVAAALERALAERGLAG